MTTKIVTITTKDAVSKVTRGEVEEALKKYPKYKVATWAEVDQHG
jgi:hypothetical protein